MISKWKKQVLDTGASVFANSTRPQVPEEKEKKLYEQLGRAAMEIEITISMDGKGWWVDNVYVERFWRTLKRECIYACGIETVGQLHVEVARYIIYYNTYRLHSSLGYQTPASAYMKSLNSNPEFIAYCNWSPEEEWTLISKKIVLPTMGLREVSVM